MRAIQAGCWRLLWPFQGFDIQGEAPFFCSFVSETKLPLPLISYDPDDKRMTKFVVALTFCALLLVGGCGRTVESEPGAGASDGVGVSDGVGGSAGARAGVSPELQAVAVQLLGSGAEVLASGDLAGNGSRQVLVISRSETQAAGSAMADSSGAGSSAADSGAVFSRAAILEQRGSKWNEVLLCDEFLKNPKGFLAGTPLSQVTAWRLQIGSHTESAKIAEFDFTPLQQGGTGRLPAIVVRWNRSAERYQSFDTNAKQFLSEAMSLETPRSELR